VIIEDKLYNLNSLEKRSIKFVTLQFS